MPSRLIYQNWIVKMGRDPADLNGVEFPPDPERLVKLLTGSAERSDSDQDSSEPDSRTERTIKAVREGLEQLEEEEREFVHLFYFRGESYREIAERSGRAIHRLEALHRRAIRRLKSILSEYVNHEFSLEPDRPDNCPICASTRLHEIEALLDAKKERETWRRTIKILKSRFGIRIKTPQTLIGHQRFHRQQKEQKG